MSTDTIAAIATAPGRAGVAVVRVSGPEALAIGERITGRQPIAGEVRFARFLDRPRRLSTAIDGDRVAVTPIDEGLLLTFRAPRSYTGEDVVEFHCHGGAVTPRRVLEACFSAGARLARRGEFTERAFLNGKLDYDQAESVINLIDAKTVRAADAALAGLSGRRANELRALYTAALDASTRVEHALDISEEELPPDFLPETRRQVEALAAAVGQALRKANEGHILREGALVVLAGPPNVGKSSLLNVLLETNRAIVSDVPGTTRDSIEEWLDLDGWPIRLVDTAGLRAAGDAIEAEGVRRSEELIAKADIVISLMPADGGRPHSTALGGDRQPSRGVLIDVTSKCDLGRGDGLNVSARTGEGLAELRQAIVAALERRAGDVTDRETADAFSASDLAALCAAQKALADALGTAVAGDLVLCGNALRRAADGLGELVGETYSDDLLENLFSRFCVGK